MKHKYLEKAFAQCDLQRLQEKVTPFVGPSRIEKIDQVIDHRLQSIHLAIEAPSNINNAMAAIRSAESLGIYHIHIIAPEHEAQAVRVITQGAYFWVNIHFYASLEEFLQTLKTSYHWPQQMVLAGAALTDTSSSLANIPVDKSLCLLIGNEQRGLTEQAKQACDYCYMIPMAGMSQSFNLSVAAAISMYDTTQRKRQALDGKTDLTGDEQQYLKTSYLLNSVDGRLAEQLVKQSVVE